MMDGVKCHRAARRKVNVTAAISAGLFIFICKWSLASGDTPSWKANEARASQATWKAIFENPAVIKAFIDGTKTSDQYPDLFQDKITTPFPCRFGHKTPRRSEKCPQSVHELRPGDIDVIGAIGDSITSATGATSLSVSTRNNEDRGYAFTTGGTGTWNTVTSVANILRVFNPKLRGYSTGRGDYTSKEAGLNVAVKFALDDDLILQAKYLTSKMKMDHEIDFEKDWKLVFIMIGHNDICSSQCFDPIAQSPDAHKENIKAAVDYLFQHMPRVFVAIISMIDTSLLARVPNTDACVIITRKVVCPCLAKSSNISQDLVDMSVIVRAYQMAELNLTKHEKYKTRKDFALEFMPSTQIVNGPTKYGDPETPVITRIWEEKPIYTPECSHLNQRGTALVARRLWNNLLQPAGKKSTSYTGDEDFLCPTMHSPYLFTKLNSKKWHH